MLSDIFNLDGEVAAVICGTGALGGAMAEALAVHGARVAILGRSEERGRQRVQTIEATGGRAMFQSADALDLHSLRAARETIANQLGPVTVLVNAAGRGSIINIASMAGMIPLSRVVAYAAAKAAVINLTQFLAREWATKGVRVNAISPGFFPAEQNRALLFKEDGTYTERGHQIINHTPMARFGEAHELAGATVWLASSQASSFVTGQNIVVDGGFSSSTI
jgi:NAD(P)-dependent dehydrogenase (short-subunit alcohol dehydrogenase family)